MLAKRIAEEVTQRVTKDVIKKISANPSGKTDTGQRPDPVNLEPKNDSLVGLLNR